MGNHGLLLRLLESKSFFTVHAALQYLKLYSDNVGITYYLTRRLREIDIQELREVWGFIWYSPTIVHVITPRKLIITSSCSHLLITRPSKSRALECFVCETSERSTHIALSVRVLGLEASQHRSNLSTRRHYGLCKRLFKIQLRTSKTSVHSKHANACYTNVTI